VSAARSRAKRGEGERLRDEILDAAEALLNETGSADKVSTRAVATRVGCTSPSIYLHFEDRAALLFAVCERQFEKLAHLLAQAASSDAAVAGGPAERLKALGRAYCDFALENPQQYRTMMMDVIAGVAYEKSLEDMRAELGFDLLVDIIEDGIADGTFADLEPTQAGFTFWCVVHGMVSLMIAKPGMAWPTDGSLREFVLNQAITGILPSPDHPARATRRASEPRTPAPL
jgi:AcrR family transcriptional regulator